MRALTLLLIIPTFAFAQHWEVVEGLGDSRCLVQDVEHGRILAGKTGGLSLYYPATGEVVDHYDPGAGEYVEAILPDPVLDSKILAGIYTSLFDGWISLSEDGGESFTILYYPVPPSGAFTDLARDPLDASRIYACSMIGGGPGRVARSDDGGDSWSEVFADGSSSYDLEIGPAGVLYRSAFGGIFRSFDRGGTWEAVLDVDDEIPIESLAADPGLEGHLYAGVGGHWAPDDQDPVLGLYESFDHGDSWTQILAGNVLGLSLYATDPDVLAVLRGGVPDVDVLVLSTDGGQSWQSYMGDLEYPPNAPILLSSVDHMLYAGYFEEMLRTDIAPTPALGGAAPGAELASGAFPNPFNPETTIRFTLPENARVDAAILDLSGRRVRRLAAAETMEAGGHALRWDGRDDAGAPVASGVYLYRLTAGDRLGGGKLVLLK